MWAFLLLACSEAPCRGEACIAQAEAAPDDATALRLFDQACADGIPSACGEAARRREFGEGVPVDTARAFAAYRALCDAGNGHGCMAVGNMYAKGTAPGGADPAQARALLTRSCETHGWALGCVSLAQVELKAGDRAAARRRAQQGCDMGELYGCGFVEEIDASAPIALEETACAGDDLHACLTFTEALLDGAGGAARIPEARQRLETLCDGRGFAPACMDLGLALSAGLGGPADPAAAARRYETACASVPKACFNLALLLKEGRGVERDLPRALTLLSGACDTVPDACVMAGNTLADQGRSLEARPWWERGCTGGVPMGCSNLAVELLDPPAGTPGDPARGVTLARDACDAGEPFACGVWGRELTSGRYVPADPAKGAELLLGACKRGMHAACEAIGAR